MAEAVTIPVELSVEQLVQAIRRLSVDRQKEVLEAFEDLVFGLLIAETEDDEMLSKEAAIAYTEQIDAQGTS
jgi:hypothetical protein